jgi:Acyl-CoA dehydrogenase, N-terminal domain/Serine dehydrogenase proteinase
VLRAIHLTDPAVPLDIVLHTPGGLVLAALRELGMDDTEIAALREGGYRIAAGGRPPGRSAVDFQFDEVQQSIRRMVKEFVDREVRPVAMEYELEDRYPTPLVERMRELGFFGFTILEQ